MLQDFHNNNNNNNNNKANESNVSLKSTLSTDSDIIDKTQKNTNKNKTINTNAINYGIKAMDSQFGLIIPQTPNKDNNSCNSNKFNQMTDQKSSLVTENENENDIIQKRKTKTLSSILRPKKVSIVTKLIYI